MKLNKPAALLIANGITEGVDAIRATYNALPDAIKNKNYRPSPQRMAYLIYRNFDVLDYQQAAKNIIDDQIQDFIYGKIGQTSAKASKLNPLFANGRGFQTGPVF